MGYKSDYLLLDIFSLFRKLGFWIQFLIDVETGFYLLILWWESQKLNDKVQQFI